MKEKGDKCEICGKILLYDTSSAKFKKLDCIFCGKTFETNIYCPEGHYICDSCHSKGPIEIIEEFSYTTTLKDPFEIVDHLMQHSKFKLYGPEHHVVTPVAILLALKNNGIKKPNGEEITFFDIKEAIRRASKIPGGWCGFYGSCGAGIGSGVAISIFTGANPSTNEPRTLANEMTSRSLNKIADNLEHCCKRSVRISISEALDFLKEKYGINLNYKSKKCLFSSNNSKCEKENCLIF